MVLKNTPADNRLRSEDVVLEVAYRPFGRTEVLKTPIYGPDDLMREVGLLPPGTEIELRVWRKGHDAVFTMPITLGKWPVIDEEGIVAPNRQYVRGLLVDYSTARRKYLSKNFGAITQVPVGVVVLDVAPGTPAARQNFQAGDLIVRVNRTVVTSSRQFAELLKDGTTASIALESRETKELPPN
jgi:serine protease Do